MKKFRSTVKKYGGKFLKFIAKYLEFSKLICYIMTALVVYVSYKVLGFAETSIVNGYVGSLPYLTTMISAVWAAYGTVLSFIVNKSKAENKIKIEKNYSRNEYYGDDEYGCTDGSDSAYSGGI